MQNEAILGSWRFRLFLTPDDQKEVQSLWFHHLLAYPMKIEVIVGAAKWGAFI